MFFSCNRNYNIVICILLLAANKSITSVYRHRNMKIAKKNVFAMFAETIIILLFTLMRIISRIARHKMKKKKKTVLSSTVNKRNEIIRTFIEILLVYWRGNYRKYSSKCAFIDLMPSAEKVRWFIIFVMCKLIFDTKNRFSYYPILIIQRNSL